MKAFRRIASTLLLFTLVFGGSSLMFSKPAEARTTTDVTGTVTTATFGGKIMSQTTKYSHGWPAEPRSDSFIVVKKEYLGTSYYSPTDGSVPKGTTIATATYRYTITERF